MFARFVTGLTLLAVAASTSTADGQIALARTGTPHSHNLPPAQMLMEPGPGVGGPGPGVLNASAQPGGGGGGPAYGPFGAVTQQNVQVLFDRPELMNVSWDISGIGRYDSVPLTVPGRQNFAQGGIFRLKIGNIDGRPGMELYPTLEIGTATPRTAAYLGSQRDSDSIHSGRL